MDSVMNWFRVRILVVIAMACFANGCVSFGTDGIVQIGPDLYMVGRTDIFEFSGSRVKANLYKDASKYCTDGGRVMLPVNSTGQDMVPGTYRTPGTGASAEIQFLCLLPTDPRVSQ